MLQFLNFKTVGIGLAVLSSLLSLTYWKGCGDGKEIGRQQERAEMQKEVDDWKGKYLNLRDAPTKTVTVTKTVYIQKPGRVDTVMVLWSDDSTKTSKPYTVESPGTMQVSFLPVTNQFIFDFKPSPMRIDTVIVTETKWAVEYRDVNVFEKVEFYIGAVIAGIGGYALAGGF